MSGSLWLRLCAFSPGAKLRTKLPATALRPPLFPLPASAQWFAPVGALPLCITAPLASAQSELQPGNRAHTEPRCLRTARSPPLASASLSVFASCVGRSILPSSLLPLLLSFLLVCFLPSYFDFSFFPFFLFFFAANFSGWLDFCLLSCESVPELLPAALSALQLCEGKPIF